MINQVYTTVQTILTKEQDGYLTPAEFNTLARQVQEEIFQGYFDQLNRNRVRDKRGLTDKGLAEISAQLEEKINQFAVSGASLTESSGVYTLPTDLYFILPDGIRDSNGRVVEEVTRNQNPYVSLMSDYTESNAKTTYPYYKRSSSTTITANVTGIGALTIDYIRKPAEPKWTYNTVSGNPVFNISAGTYQDFELHPSEFSEIVLRMVQYFGINLRETQITQLAQGKEVQEYNKENQ